MTTATDKLLRDLDAATQIDAALPSQSAAVGVALRQYRAAARLRVALPLTWLEEAREEMERFIRFRLEELRSQQETKKLIGELSCRMADHRGRIRQLLCSEPLRHPEVVLLVMVGLAVDRPLESNFFPGLLEGLLGSLGIAAPGEGNPATSSHEGASRTWSTAVHQALSRLGQEESETPGTVGLPPDLNLHHEEVFLEKQKHLVPPIFSDPLFHLSQRTVGSNQRYQNQRSPPQVPHSPLNRFRNEPAGLSTLSPVRPTSPSQRRNGLVGV